MLINVMNRIRFYNNELDPPNNNVKLGKGSKVLRVDTRDYTVNLSPKVPESKHTQNYIVSPQLTFSLLSLFKTIKFVCSKSTVTKERRSFIDSSKLSAHIYGIIINHF